MVLQTPTRRGMKGRLNSYVLIHRRMDLQLEATQNRAVDVVRAAR